MSIRLALIGALLAAPQLLAAPAVAQASAHEAVPAAAGKTKVEWNDPEDIALVTGAFATWLDAVLVKDRATAESFHDEGFRSGSGDKLLDKKGHVDVQMTVGNKEMKLVTLYATRRIGDILLVWSNHFIRADPVPEIPALGLVGDWGGREAAKLGFEQRELSVWRFEGGKLTCLAFTASRKPPEPAGPGK